MAHAVPVTGKDILAPNAKVAAVPATIHAVPATGACCGRSPVPFRCSRMGLYAAALLLAVGTLVAQAIVMSATGHYTFYTLNNSYSGYYFSNFIRTYTVSIMGKWLAKEPYLVIAVGSITAALALVHLVFLFFPIVSASLAGAIVETTLVPLALCLWLAAVGVLGKTVHVFKDTAGYWPNAWERGSIAALVLASVSVVVWGALLVLSILALKRMVCAWRAKQAAGGQACARAPNGADAA